LIKQGDVDLLLKSPSFFNTMKGRRNTTTEYYS